ncbi:MAG TPA: hypothetical protein VJ838_15015 [Gaiellaceae bacterium]|nr:hypothetical protein [Gaiellaceae bacterium]
MVIPIILTAAVALVMLLYVARPFFGEPELLAPARADGRSTGRLELIEERDRVLAALKELEFDHRTGKVSEGDYRELIGPLRRRAVDTLRALDPVEPPVRSARRRHEVQSRAKVHR